MGKETLLLYRIDEFDRKVVFINTVNSRKAWRSLSDRDEIIMSFDDVLNSIIQLTNDFRVIEIAKNTIRERIDLNINEELKEFEEKYVNSTNFFTKYYAKNLYTTFKNGSARQKYIPDVTIFTLKSINRAIIDLKFLPMKHAVFSDDYATTTPLKKNKLVRKKRVERIIISQGLEYNVLNVSNRSLSNFFQDFSSSIYKMGLSVCTCNYCHKYFLETDGSLCCDSDSCYELYQEELRHKERREKDYDTYQQYITKLSNYIGFRKRTLSDNVIGNPELAAKWDMQRKVFMQDMKDLIEIYKAENRQPDKYLDNKYDDFINDVTNFRDELEKEAKEQNEDNEQSE